ncbi:GntR family transcriptional regulator [Thermomonospora echinospora]|uniref:GntR family transcriptional regulator n=1 Tax=Thermomonospora echinospora TaxID=1992 RepID=A0A1H6CR62_9ACTN|nr:GntR family transcriptional regulator [Thermomonospora echinospora]SEG75490.1 GntR family transcriptional regulator [Thermomonospora echinospora]
MALESVPPKYAQLVAELKRRIEAGQYPPGEMLPSEHQLIAEFSVSRPTVVAALRVLREEGWIEARQGKGRFVRGRPVLSALEHVRAGQLRLSGPEIDLAGDVVEAGAVTAPKRIAALLDVPASGRVFLRRRLLTYQDEPSELLSLWLPLELAEGTGLTSDQPLRQGIREHLESRKGVVFDHVLEQITARMPTTEEAQTLGLGRDVPVLVVFAAVRDATGRPLLVVEAVLPADRHELEDAYPLR